MTNFKSNLPDWFSPSRRSFPARPDNVARGKDNAEKIAETMTALHQNPEGPYSEWKNGRPSMNRENITTEHLNTNPDIVKKKIENSKKWNSSEAGKEAYLRGREKIRKAIKDPNNKVWISAQEAALIWFPGKSLERAVKTIRFLISKKQGWEYVQK